MTKVNDQVTDAVSQMNALLTGGAPSHAMGMLDVAGTETISMGMFNAITAQQNAQTSASAAATASCANMLKVAKPAAPDPSSKMTLALALSEVKLAEQQIVTKMALATIKGLLKGGSITNEQVENASNSAKGSVKGTLSSAELSSFTDAMQTFENDVKALSS